MTCIRTRVRRTGRSTAQAVLPCEVRALRGRVLSLRRRGLRAQALTVAPSLRDKRKGGPQGRLVRARGPTSARAILELADRLELRERGRQLRLRRRRSSPSESLFAIASSARFFASIAFASSRSCARIAVSASTVTLCGCTSRKPPCTNTSSSSRLVGHLDAHRARPDLREERRVPRIDAELALDAGQHDELRLAGVDLLFRADDVDVDRVGHGRCPNPRY